MHKRNKWLPSSNVEWTSMILRAGLAFCFIYAAISSIKTPDLWLDYVPEIVEKFISPTLFLSVISFAQLGLAILLLSGYFKRLAALGAFALLVPIVAFNPELFIITFRDLTIAAMAVALFVLESPSTAKK